MLRKVFNKIFKSSEPKLVAVFSYRYDSQLIPDLKKNLADFVDDFVEYDDTLNPKEWYHEGEVRNKLIQLAKNKGADWILCIDPDERFEKNAGKEIRKLIKEKRKVIYGFRFRELWNSAIHYRNDGIWGQKKKLILFPVYPDQTFMNLPVHSQWHPQNGDYEIIITDINLYHLKMIEQTNREARKELYNKLDPDKKIQSIGYDYLTDESGIELVEISEDKQYFPVYNESYNIRQTM